MNSQFKILFAVGSKINKQKNPINLKGVVIDWHLKNTSSHSLFKPFAHSFIKRAFFLLIHREK